MKIVWIQHKIQKFLLFVLTNTAGSLIKPYKCIICIKIMLGFFEDKSQHYNEKTFFIHFNKLFFLMKHWRKSKTQWAITWYLIEMSLEWMNEKGWRHGQMEPLLSCSKVNWCRNFEKILWRLFGKLKIDLLHDSKILPLRLYLKKLKSRFWRDDSNHMFIVALTTLTKMWKQNVCG